RRGQQAAALRVVRRGGGYLGADTVVDLRVDDHARPIEELARLYGLHQLYFGATPLEEWRVVDRALERELRDRLGRLGYASGDLAADLDTWAGVENLEERVRGIERIDPVVLGELQRQDETEVADGRRP
ncbi:MAG: putative peptidoglycan binding domain-containing protein, partial [Thermoleophilaceae bacterium]